MPDKETRNQVFTERLSAGALQQLKQWLIDEGNSETRAVFTTELIKAFYRHYVVPTMHYPVKVGITVKKAEYGGGNTYGYILSGRKC